MQTPIFRLVGEINEENVSAIVEGLAGLPQCRVEKAILIVDSDGGSIEEGFRLIDAIRIIQSKGVVVQTVVTGKAYSMGLYITLAAKERTAYPSARMMAHPARYNGLSESEIYTAKSLKILASEMEYFDSRFRELLSNVGISQADVDSLLSGDTYLTVSDAIRYGIVQRIETEVI